MRYDWTNLKKELQDRLEKAVPGDLKDYTGIIDSKGYCSFCHQKEVLYLDRKTKKSFCINCRPYGGYEFTALEFDNMWQLVQDTLFYTNEIIMELTYPNLDFASITPEKMKTCLVNRGWVERSGGNRDVWKFSKEYKSVEFFVFVPAHRDLVDFHRAVEIVIETVSKVENQSPYEIFLTLSC